MNFGKMKKMSRPISRVTGTVSQSSMESDVFSDYGDDNKNNKRVNRNMSEKKRRDQFNVLVNELCSMVSTTNKKMDKSTVLKSTIAYLKNYQETAEQAQAHEIKEDWKPSFLSNNEFTHLMLEALDSCLFVFTQQGSILYVSESITSLLGYLPNDLVNKYVYSYIHENEKQNLYNMLFHFSMLSPEEMEKEKNQLSFSCHFQRGSLRSEESNVYESVTFTGFQYWNVVSEDDSQTGLQPPTNCFCCTVRLKSSQFIREMAIIDESQSEFTSRHSLEWKFLFLDHRASPIIGYLPFEVLGTSGFDYYHPDDLEPLVKCHEQLMQIGKGMSCFYRFLTKGQQWIWLKSRYYITYHQWNSKPEFIVCTNTVVSYADVRAHVRQENGEEAQNVNLAAEHRKRPQSPSMSSVLSGQSSKTSDKDSVDSSPLPHSTCSKDPTGSVTPQLQQLLQQRINQQKAIQQQQELTTQIQLLPQPSLVTGLLAGKVATISNLPSGLGLTQQVKTQSVPTPHCNLPVVTVIPTKPSSTAQSQQAQMTPVQRQLHSQLLQKHKLLQQAILKQQEELQLINQQLSLFQPTVVPVFPVTASFSSVSAMPGTGIMMTSMPAQTTQAPLTFQPALHSPVQSTMDQQQYVPLQFLQPDNEVLFSNDSSSKVFSLT
ncbi:circadian locomoter output cycles protein kaput-like [Ylistrum balloti]|uniref:circadian locomoter output cycles protein kaput-like n=1 Tax=Ylistrum balloti TaxID=509963 RepID=UPI002905EA69|nr:circadian locomoter output cycles protein kaput-like [Ylistrum balloti]